MDIKDYIESGILELYVAGKLSEKESADVYNKIKEYPEALNEVLKIEESIVKLTSAVSLNKSSLPFSEIKSRLKNNKNETKVVTLDAGRNNWFKYTGWAAAVLLTVGLLWTTYQNQELKSKISVVELDKELLEVQIEKANKSIIESKKLISILRDRNILSIPLPGQAISPESYAAVYWDKSSNSVYVDAQGLPDPPKGKVYQVWSLKLKPLTPVSIGIIENFTTDDDKIFAMMNPNDSEAFGITLEPEGGSKMPSLDQLYTLGTVASIDQ